MIFVQSLIAKYHLRRVSDYSDALFLGIVTYHASAFHGTRCRVARCIPRLRKGIRTFLVGDEKKPASSVCAGVRKPNHHRGI